MQKRLQSLLVSITALVLVLFIGSLQAQNLIQNSNMEEEGAWQAIWYNAEEQPVYEFGYTVDSLFAISPLRGGALRVTLDDGATGGQLLLYQRVTCIAGQEYKASALIKVLDYDAPADQKGQWFQFYVAVDEPDPGASDYNPGGAKMFNMSSWDGDMVSTWEDMNGYWESVKMNSEIETAPYWVCPGDEGTEVEVTVGVKFGSTSLAGAFFDLVVDDVCFYPMEANKVAGSNMEDEAAWVIQYYNADSMPEYEFAYEMAESPEYIRGQSLHITLPDVAGGQLLFYQRLALAAGKTYRASGAIHILDYQSTFEPVSQGPWYQFYVALDEPPAEGDFNPGDAKMFDISAWDADCDMWDFEQFQGYWEQVRCVSEIETAPYFTVPGDAGETVDVTVGVKFGLWAPEPAFYELVVDDIQLFWADEAEAGTAVEEKADPSQPNEFVLDNNYPNPFNPTTTISYSIPTAAHTTLKVYNTIGVEVATLVDGQVQAGRHAVSFEAVNLPSGIYYYTLRQNNFTATKKCVVLK